MPTHQLFPTSITQFSTESLIKRHSTKSKAIFWVNVDVTIHSRGIITSKDKTIKLVTPIFDIPYTYNNRHIAINSHSTT